MPGTYLFADALAAGTAEEPLAAITAPAFVERICGFCLPSRKRLLFALAGLLLRRTLFGDLLALAFKLATFAFESAFLVGYALAFQPDTLLFQRFRRQPSGVIGLHLTNHSLRACRVGGVCGIR